MLSCRLLIILLVVGVEVVCPQQMQFSTQNKQRGYCAGYKDMLETPPAIHGKVEKKGYLPTNLWWNVQGHSFFRKLNQTMKQQRLSFENGLVMQDRTVTQEVFKIPMSTQCQIYIDHKHRIIYVKNAKTAANSIFHLLRRKCLSAEEHKQKKQCYKQGVDASTIRSVEDASRIWMEYFVFAAIRNPYSRASSAYTYMLKRRRLLGKQFRPGCSKSPTFQSFCRTPYVIGMQTQRYGCSDMNQHDYLQVESQSQCLKTANGQLAVDYIIALETLHEDWNGLAQAMLQKTGINQTQINYYNKIKQQTISHQNIVSSQSQVGSELYEHCGQTCAQGIAKYYNDDFNTFGYQNCMMYT
eukprot:TRINITY_DN4155_c0_g1_i1.p1 TRINITY_DN4155_c0_g1~~TRINITY_DN4155_c0_g1_i1.p1  ORF type:complete len:354 (+),score=22.03 TRINITY_DN4155_c0_g1_i1:108-1169(+)